MYFSKIKALGSYRLNTSSQVFVANLYSRFISNTKFPGRDHKTNETDGMSWVGLVSWSWDFNLRRYEIV